MSEVKNIQKYNKTLKFGVEVETLDRHPSTTWMFINQSGLDFEGDCAVFEIDELQELIETLQEALQVAIANKEKGE